MGYCFFRNKRLTKNHTSQENQYQVSMPKSPWNHDHCKLSIKKTFQYKKILFSTLVGRRRLIGMTVLPQQCDMSSQFLLLLTACMQHHLAALQQCIMVVKCSSSYSYLNFEVCEENGCIIAMIQLCHINYIRENINLFINLVFW